MTSILNKASQLTKPREIFYQWSLIHTYIYRKNKFSMVILIQIILKYLYQILLYGSTRAVSRGAGVQVCDCKRDCSWVRFPLGEIICLFKFIISFLRSGVDTKVALSSATQHAMLSELYSKKRGTKCLTTRFPLPILLCQGYSEKLIWFMSS